MRMIEGWEWAGELSPVAPTASRTAVLQSGARLLPWEHAFGLGWVPEIVAVDSFRSAGCGIPWVYGPPSGAMIRFRSESTCFGDN